MSSCRPLVVAGWARGRHDKVDETEELIRGAAQHPGQGADLRGRRLASPGPPLPPGDRAHVAAERLSQGGLLETGTLAEEAEALGHDEAV